MHSILGDSLEEFSQMLIAAHHQGLLPPREGLLMHQDLSLGQLQEQGFEV